MNTSIIDIARSHVYCTLHCFTVNERKYIIKCSCYGYGVIAELKKL